MTFLILGYGEHDTVPPIMTNMVYNFARNCFQLGLGVTCSTGKQEVRGSILLGANTSFFQF